MLWLLKCHVIEVTTGDLMAEPYTFLNMRRYCRFMGRSEFNTILLVFFFLNGEEFISDDNHQICSILLVNFWIFPASNKDIWSALLIDIVFWLRQWQCLFWMCQQNYVPSSYRRMYETFSFHATFMLCYRFQSERHFLTFIDVFFPPFDTHQRKWL